MATMAKLTVVSAALFYFLALSSASEPPQLIDVSTGGDQTNSLAAFDPLIELPQFQPDQESTVVTELPESTEDLTPVTFLPEDHGNHKGQFSDENGSDEAEEQKSERWVKFHHHHHGHGKPKFGDRSEMREMEGESDDVRRPHHHHHHHLRFEREGDDEREGHHDQVNRRFDREEDEEKEGRHSHGDHHHHHHHHHHDEEEQDEESGGVLMKIRKFLM